MGESLERASDYLLELDGLTKAFPGVLANDHVSFRVGHGEIHALLGENGAGKSTLVKMIYGVLRPDSGTMHLHGETYAPAKPSEARAHGIGMVFQHFSLFEALTVKENIELGISPELAKGDLRKRIVEVSNYYGLKLDPDRLVGDLSVGQRQRVEIVRCLLQNPRLIIMDEPTSVLTPQEAEVLFATLRRLAAEGCSILYISHKLEEIRALCHSATILRAGRVVATTTPSEQSAKSLAEMMIGAILMPPKRESHPIGEVRLRLDRLTLPGGQPFGVDLSELSLDVRAGEIVGIAGVAGNGQEELMTVLIGEHRTQRAEDVLLDGKPVGDKGPDERRALGMCFVPEERLGHAAVPNMTLVENTVLSARVRKGLCRSGFVKLAETEHFSRQIVDGFNVKTAGITHAARSLSGGNLQKFIMGREILQSPTMLVASQPTWGVDAGAASAIHQALLRLARDGTAILIISQDLDELMAICDRIAVIADGRLTQARPVETLTLESIGINMGGTAEGRAAHA
jgi:simple sugar transport system ATP-binding protein